MKTSFLILIFFTLWNISSSLLSLSDSEEKSHHSPCIHQWGRHGFCVPNRQCCSGGSWNYNSYDRGDCRLNQFCCVYGTVLCQSKKTIDEFFLMFMFG